jgi:hypothetical protein
MCYRHSVPQGLSRKSRPALQWQHWLPGGQTWKASSAGASHGAVSEAMQQSISNLQVNLSCGTMPHNVLTK